MGTGGYRGFPPVVLTPVLTAGPLTFLMTLPSTQFNITESHEGADGIGAGSSAHGSPQSPGFRPMSKPGVEVRLEANDPLEASVSKHAGRRLRYVSDSCTSSAGGGRVRRLNAYPGSCNQSLRKAVALMH